MASERQSGRYARLANSPLMRVVAYYVILFATTALLIQFVPGAGELFSAGLQQNVADTQTGLPDLINPGQPLFQTRLGLPLSEVFGMTAAFALMLPVTWIYVMTRRRKGFRQSVVQTLIILPIVVAGIVFMVKNSLALAFSLGGIVAAVSFRNTLRDTKDAVYIFLGTGVGLAAGIQSVPLAAALSVTFNIVILILWYTDFGRAPADLQRPVAQRRVQRALALANRTSAFLDLVDDQILKSLTPDQLDALAERASKRRSRLATDEDAPKRPPPEYRRLELQIHGPADAARRVVESVLEQSVKRWEFLRALPGDAGAPERLQYRVRLRKSIPPERLIQSLRTGAAPHVTAVELGDGAR